MKKFFNPVTDTVLSQSSVNKETVASNSSAFSITDPTVCPKCNSATQLSKILSGESVYFCTNCRVTMPMTD